MCVEFMLTMLGIAICMILIGILEMCIVKIDKIIKHNNKKKKLHLENYMKLIQIYIKSMR